MRRPSRAVLGTTAASTLTAVLGSVGTRAGSTWYRELDKPSWQPPGEVFGPTWTSLYGLIAGGTGRSLARLPGRERPAYWAALGTNLALNAAWSWLFFTAHRPRWALIDSLLLEFSTLDLLRRSARVDRPAALMLAPYAGWVAFATILVGEISRRNA
ncbi:MAG TPA: TspO/MBR family protein [Segeticoccus sp.]|jgi:tryptophan-rich sensory protein|nr:TspO/MBR family protein [Segeticoccus sp.]